MVYFIFLVSVVDVFLGIFFMYIIYMKNILYWKIAQSGSGLSNQLFTFVTGILTAINENKNIMILDDFFCDFLEEKKTSISEIIDIEKLNLYLKNSKINVILFDKNKIIFDINFINYGINNQVKDVTQKISNHCYTHNKKENQQIFNLKKEVSFNTIVDDYFPGLKKKLTIYYSLNNYLFKEEYEENRKEDILYDLQNSCYQYRFGWINHINSFLFEKIIQELSFNDNFQKMADIFLEKINKNNKSSKINVIHLRIEEDAIDHFCKTNLLEKKKFQKKFEEKYISLIQENINKEDPTIILSYSTNNRVIDFLESNHYSFYFKEKDKSKGREWNAIVDLHIALFCNNFFIGHWSKEKSAGSTFTYLISQKLKKEVKQILFHRSEIEK